MLARAVACVSVALIVVACAEGENLVGGSGPDGGGSVNGGGPGNGGNDAVSSSASSMNTTTTGPNDGGSNEGGSGEGGIPAVGGGGEGGEGGAPGPVCDYAAPEVCAQAELLPAVAGDEGSDVVTRMGDSSRWFKVHIEEQSSSISESDLSYTVKLTSPPGMNYDLKVHQGPQDGSPDCNGTLKLGAGNPETVSDSWDDDQGIGGEDDSTWLVIEIVYVSGTTCGSSSQWTLEVRGNT
ncbi:MAG: hypothetical protein HOW73_37450 [Polyangiaceae bacterium]|nr:hypothetical protein [Polyangiaceae bacterium]